MARAAEVSVRMQRSDERRRRLVQAARELLNEADGGAFSMSTLAQRAGLSLATPYNLFGSKAAILHAVFAAEVEGLHRAASALQVGDPLDHIFTVANLLSGVFARRPQFYRGLSRSLAALGPVETRQLVTPLGDAMLAPLVGMLDEAGLLIEGLPRHLLWTQLGHAIESVVMHWTALEWTPERMAAELRLGFALALLGGLAEPYRARLVQAIAAEAERLARDETKL